MTDLTKSTKKILVVEDDPEIRRIIAIALTQNTAQDGWFDALRETESNKNHRPDSGWVSYRQDGVRILQESRGIGQRPVHTQAL